MPVSVNVFRFFLITVDTVRKLVMHRPTQLDHFGLPVTLQTWSSFSRKGNPLSLIISSAIPFVPRKSPTALVTSRTIWSNVVRNGNLGRQNLNTMVGRIYVKAPVSSNMITTTVTVILITPLKSISINSCMKIM